MCSDMELKIDHIRFVTAPPQQQREGLLGWVTCTLNDKVQMSGLMLRRTLQGNFVLSFPSRRDSHGTEHFFLKPLNDQARREIEYQVFRSLGLVEDTSR